MHLLVLEELDLVRDTKCLKHFLALTNIIYTGKPLEDSDVECKKPQKGIKGNDSVVDFCSGRCKCDLAHAISILLAWCTVLCMSLLWSCAEATLPTRNKFENEMYNLFSKRFLVRSLNGNTKCLFISIIQ